MSEKKDWSLYARHGVPVENFFLLANALKVYAAANGVEGTNKSDYAAKLTEELCEEWLAHNPSEKVREALTEMAQPQNVKPPKVVPLGAKAPEMQVSPAICGHQSDPDPNGTRHTCTIAGGHIGKHEDQEWYWFLTDWRPTRKTL